MSTLEAAAWIASAALVAGGGVALVWAVDGEVHAAVEQGAADNVTSKPCVMCHPDHYASWRRTFHRTMTQVATPNTVLGDFSGKSYTFEGVTSRFSRSGDGFVMETLDPETKSLRAFEVRRTIGSRRVQQYVARMRDRWIRLPLAWNIEEKRWFHLNGGFLHPDGADFSAHTSLWDGNCIFCHNTKPKPGYDFAKQTYSSEVAELGIACESCHGPGGEHVARNTNPMRRYYLYFAKETRDPTMTSPHELDKTKSVQVCGRCHGQRLPNPEERIVQFLRDGDPFTPGDDLGKYTTPIWRDTKLAGVDLSLRFWGDGTPRLTAYEYQGLLMSKDHQKGELTCISCHTMHGGDPRGMIEEKMRGPAACRPCHVRESENAAKHARHEEGSTGTDCYACHMPKIVYGLLDVHPTHRIQNPEPARAWRHHMPEACTLCHLDKSARWAAKSIAHDLGGIPPRDLPPESEDLAESVRFMLSGDVVARAVAVMSVAEKRSYTDDARARLWVVPFLIITLEDRYPAIRHFAFRALRVLAERAKLNPPPAFDSQATPEERRRSVAGAWTWWRALDKSGIAHPGRAVPLDPQLEPIAATIDALLRAQINETIAIGE